VIDLFPKRYGPVNLCHVARDVDFVSVEGDMLLCAQDYRARHRFGNVHHQSLIELHRQKLLGHLRGTTTEVCSTCSFCPEGFAGGADLTNAVDLAGAFDDA
jgi:radical SAM protein with 4Fe4S-binding SPASM domain